MKNSTRTNWRRIGLVMLAVVAVVCHAAWAQRDEPDPRVPRPYGVTYASARGAGMMQPLPSVTGGGVATGPVRFRYGSYFVSPPIGVRSAGMPFAIDPTPSSMVPIISRVDMPLPTCPAKFFGTYPYTRGITFWESRPGIYSPASTAPLIPIQPPRPCGYVSRAELP